MMIILDFLTWSCCWCIGGHWLLMSFFILWPCKVRPVCIYFWYEDDSGIASTVLISYYYYQMNLKAVHDMLIHNRLHDSSSHQQIKIVGLLPNFLCIVRTCTVHKDFEKFRLKNDFLHNIVKFCLCLCFTLKNCYDYPHFSSHEIIF